MGKKTKTEPTPNKPFRDAVFNTFSGMFEYNGLPDTVRPEFIEKYYTDSGKCALYELPESGDIYPLVYEYAGAPDPYGLGENVILRTDSGRTYTLNRFNKEEMQKCVLGWNNNNGTGDSLNALAADLMNEISISFRLNVLYSRLRPIFRATDDKQKVMLESMLKKVLDGDASAAIVSDNFLRYLDEGLDPLGIVNLTDPENAGKAQYLVKAFEDLWRMLYTFNGHAIDGSGKLAQQSREEVSSRDSASFIYPLVKLKQRKKWIEEANEKFGWNASVDFSKVWNIEFATYEIENPEEGTTPEESEEKEGEEDASNE